MPTNTPSRLPTKNSRKGKTTEPSTKPIDPTNNEDVELRVAEKPDPQTNPAKIIPSQQDLREFLGESPVTNASQKSGPVTITVDLVDNSDQKFLCSVHYFEGSMKRINVVLPVLVPIGFTSEHLQNAISTTFPGLNVSLHVKPDLVCCKDLILNSIVDDSHVNQILICFFDKTTRFLTQVLSVPEFLHGLETLRSFLREIKSNPHLYPILKNLKSAEHGKMEIPEWIGDDWMSVLKFLTRCILLHEFFKKLSSQHPRTLTYITDETFEHLLYLQRFLYLCYELNGAMSTESSTISQVLPAIIEMENFIVKNVMNRSVGCSLYKLFDMEFKEIRKSEMYKIAMLVDPRFAYREVLFKRKTWKKIEDSMSDTSLKKELDDYKLEFEQPDEKVDPFEWWAARQSKYPALAVKAKQYLVHPAVSVESKWNKASDSRSFCGKGCAKQCKESIDEFSIVSANNSQKVHCTGIFSDPSGEEKTQDVRSSSSSTVSSKKGKSKQQISDQSGKSINNHSKNSELVVLGTTKQKVMDYDSLKCIVGSMDVFSRSSLSKRCPALRAPVEKTSPPIRQLHLDQGLIRINTTTFKIGVICVYQPGHVVPTNVANSNKEGGLPYDVDRYGFRCVTPAIEGERLLEANNVATEDEIRQQMDEKLRILTEKLKKQMEISEFHQQNSTTVNTKYLESLQEKIGQTRAEILPYTLRNQNADEIPFRHFLQLTISSDGSTRVHTETLEYNGNFWVAFRCLSLKLLSDISETKTLRLTAFNDDEKSYFFWPAGWKITCQNLKIDRRFPEVSILITDALSATSFPLKSTTSGIENLAAYDHDIVRNSKMLIVRGGINRTRFHLIGHQRVHIDVCQIFPEDFLALVNDWTELGNPVGKKFTYAFNDEWAGKSCFQKLKVVEGCDVFQLDGQGSDTFPEVLCFPASLLSFLRIHVIEVLEGSTKTWNMVFEIVSDSQKLMF